MKRLALKRLTAFCMVKDMQIGRYEIMTDAVEVNSKNVLSILADSKSYFDANALMCQRLLDIEAGYMDCVRQKIVRPDIDIKTVDPIAHEITVFKEGYHWGIPIAFVQRGNKDSGTEKENKAISLLNECYDAENIGRVQHKLGHYVEICGIGYTYVDINTDWEDGDSYFKYEFLDPRHTFVIRSSYYSDHRVMAGVSFRTDNQGNQYFTVFTKKQRFEIFNQKIVNGKENKLEWGFNKKSGEKNPLGMIPIIEWVRADDRMGCFEREIPEMERLNLIISDIANDIDQETQMIWHSNDVEFPTDENGNEKKPKSNDWVQTYTSRDGKTPFIKPLTTPYDYAGLLNNYSTTRALILQRTYTPQRNDDSGGSTGVAMSDATGWSAADQVASSQQLLMESSKMDEVKVVLAAIKKNKNVKADNPLLDLRYMDVMPNITRQKTFEMSVKTTAFANLVSHGVYGLHALKAVHFFDDVTQVWEDSKPLIEEYQRTTFGEKEEIQKSSDLPEYQIGNSPNIDGMSKEQPEKAKENPGSTQEQVNNNEKG